MLLIHGARQIVQVADKGQTRLSGKEMKNIKVLEDPQAKLALLVDGEGRIACLGDEEDVRHHCARMGIQLQDGTELDARGGVIMPGLIDAHTHPIWAGDRVHEFAMKLAGATYLEIHAAGGGIHFTVEHTARATDEQLLNDLTNRLTQMLHAGTTTVEVKSGYGLQTPDEIRLLKLLDQVRRELPIELSITYCGPHAVPRNMTSAEATEMFITEQIPAVRKLMDEGAHIENADVFCEKGVYSTEQTRRILTTAAEIGLRINFHGDELSHSASAELGAEIGAAAVSHLEEASDEGIRAMARAGTVAVLLPTTAYTMRLRPPPTRKMIDGGLAVALGSDFNPNAHCLAMPAVMYLACVTLGLSMPEAVAAATINAAHSLGRGHSHGSLEVGKFADLLVLKAPRWEHIIYQFGSHHHVIQYVLKRGSIVHAQGEKK